MIRLGLRLTVAGGKEALARLVLIAVAVAIGVGLLLTTVASLNAVNTQNSRYAWLESSSELSRSVAASGALVAKDPLWWRLRADYYQGRLIGRVDLAATGPDSPVPVGIAKLPEPGQFYASPAMTKLLRSVPADELAARYPGVQAGIIGKAALPAPNSLLIVIGHSPADASSRAGYDEITSISATPPNQCNNNCLPGVGIDANGITLILAVVIAALLFPVLVFIGGATRLSAARREQRFAAIRLLGATPRQVAIISTVESALAAASGTALGFGLFYLLRPVLAGIPFTGSPFFTSDLSPTPLDALAVALGVPVAAALAARAALRRVNISPLGVSRRAISSPPRAWRIVPVVAGIGWLAYLAYFTNLGDSHRHGSNTQAFAYLAGIFTTMVGLVLAGPWLTKVGSRLLASRAKRPESLIAARRLADDPGARFRAISGLVLATFVGTCALGILVTISDYSTGLNGAALTSGRATLFDDVGRGPYDTRGPVIPSATMSALASIASVTGVATIRQSDRQRALVLCSELARVPALGHCPSGADVVSIQPNFGGAVINKEQMPDITWPSANLTATRFAQLPISDLVVATDGTSSAVERARTVLSLRFSTQTPPQTISEIGSGNSKQIDSYKRLADIVILTSLPIAGCSLAVGVAGGLAERRRPFSLLRLTGAPIATLRRVIMLESIGPLFAGVVVSVGAGLLTAFLFLRVQVHETLQPPGLSYYLLLIAGLAASLAVIASSLPLLDRMTGPETARND